MICRKCCRSLRPIKQTGYFYGQALIVIGVLGLTWFLYTNELEYNDIIHYDPICKFKFVSNNVKTLKTSPKLYTCPKTGIQLVGHRFNYIYIKNIDIVEAYDLKCYYKDNQGSKWTLFSLPTVVYSKLVYVQCFRNDQVIYKDVFPLIQKVPNEQNVHQSKRSARMNIIIITLKSVSAKAFRRRMPLTRNIFEARWGVMFNNLLSKGMHSIDSFTSLFRNCSLRLEGNCDERRKYLWELFQSAGYSTVYLEDSCHNAVFKKQLPGLDYQWTDNVAIEDYGNNWVNNQPYCIQNRKYHQILQKLLIEFIQTRRKLFLWLSLSFSSTNEKDLSILDRDMDNLFASLSRHGLNRSAVLLVSDQGRVTGEDTDVLRHYAERFNPIAYLMLPTHFNTVYPLVHEQIVGLSTNLINHNVLYSLVESFATLNNVKPNFYENIRTKYQPARNDKVHGKCPTDFPTELCPCKRTSLEISAFAERLVDYTLARINDYFVAANYSPYCSKLMRAKVRRVSFIDSLSVYKIRFSVFARGEYRSMDVFEAYVQVTNRRPGQWKCYRLTYREQDAQRHCLRGVEIHRTMKPLCFCE